MEFDIKPGKYILAISGGVDSMVLLDVLATKKNKNLELIAAHFNHGIRAAAKQDERLVAETAAKHDLVFEVGRTHLGKTASEAVARKARYAFLDSIKQKHGAQAIITAHHQDDLIETAILNLLRGSGRRGISAISQNPKILRPLLSISKEELIRYALINKLIWREDSTNLDEKYLRNYIRKHITANLDQEKRKQLLKNADKVAKKNEEINSIIATLSRRVLTDNQIKRYEFSTLPEEIGRELIMYWLREAGLRQFDKHIIERLSMALKTARAGTSYPITKNFELLIDKRFAHLKAI